MFSPGVCFSQFTLLISNTQEGDHQKLYNEKILEQVDIEYIAEKK